MGVLWLRSGTYENLRDAVAAVWDLLCIIKQKIVLFGEVARGACARTLRGELARAVLYSIY